MKFRDFVLKHLLSDTDQVVGYDANGEYIRCSLADLRSSLGVVNVAAQTLQVQYSSNGSSWHDTYVTGDVYMRIKAGSGSWSSAIRIAVSAYDTWKEANGGSGTVEDFLETLKGEPGEAINPSTINLSDLADYDAFLRSIAQAIDNTKAAIIAEVVESVSESVREQFNDVSTSEDIAETINLSDNDYIVINTSDGVRKVKLVNLISNINIKNISVTTLDRVKKEQRRIIPLEGLQNNSNVNFTASEAFVMGTSDLYLNGQRLVEGTDYMENNTLSITFLTQVPKSTDTIVFLAILQ